MALVILLASADLASGQGEISLSASVDKAVITIGDLITYTVTVNRENGVEVKLPTLGQNLGGFEIRDYKVIPSTEKDGRVIDRVDYTISTFEVGEFQIPPVDIAYTVPPDTVQKVLRTESINITVESVKPSEEGDVQDIRPPWEIPFNWRPVVIGVSLGLLILLLMVGLFFYFKKKKRGESILPRKIEPPRPPHEIAYKELESLGASDLLERGEVKLYYSEISDIIRRYVEGRYEIVALELTTRQLLDGLRAVQIDEDIIIIFRNFLQECDLVKFAKMVPSAEGNEGIMKMAVRIVDETRWVDVDEAADEDVLSEGDDNEPVLEASEEAGAGAIIAPDANQSRPDEAGSPGKEGKEPNVL